MYSCAVTTVITTHDYCWRRNETIRQPTRSLTTWPRCLPFIYNVALHSQGGCWNQCKFGNYNDSHDLTWPYALRWTWTRFILVANSHHSFLCTIFKLLQLKVAIKVPNDFPNSCPALCIMEPSPVKLRDGSSMPSVSGSYHTIGIERIDGKGCLKICHYDPSMWEPDDTLWVSHTYWI